MATLQRYARELVLATTLEGKRRPPPANLTDAPDASGARIDAPGRPPNLVPKRGGDVRVPSTKGMPDPAQRARILHALANHELQAIELFAWAILTFPDTPTAFRRGCLAILVDEQRHLGLYMERMQALGLSFGDEAVSSHFWNKVPHFREPLDFVCTMGLTFENANLDFAQDLATSADRVGDAATGDVLRIVHEEEIRHVRFAWHWLLAWQPEGEAPWDTYRRHVAPPHGPARARGVHFDPASRVAAGLGPAFIEALARTPPTAPGGARRR